MVIPKEVKSIIKKLEQAGFEAYIVGGCVRDILTNPPAGGPTDWDITTSAKPEEMQKIFPRSFYNNRFGTVTAVTGSKNPALKEIQITTYRTEGKYLDKRWPEKVEFVDRLEDDLSRRDFTINAMAMDAKGNIFDFFGGEKDIENKIIRAVGDPDQRFSEDALRMMRAIRFASQLNSAAKETAWQIEKETLKAIKKHSAAIGMISAERIRDELEKIILSPRPSQGIEALKESGLLRHIIPEHELGVGVSQNRHHIYTIYEHSVLSLKFCPSEKLEVRLASLFHDIAKPETKRGAGPDATFYNHDIVGAKVAKKILSRLKFPNEIIEKTSHLIRNHMFFYNIGEVTEAGVRRLVKRVGAENLKDLIDLRIADRLGSGVPKAKPYKLRHLEYLMAKVSRHPLSVVMLKIDGNDIMRLLDIKPGPIIGALLSALLAEVLEEPKLNIKKYLEKRAKELAELSIEKLKEKSEKVIQEKKEEVELVEKRRFRVQ